MGKYSGSGSRMNNPDHISESLETIFGFKYLNSLMRIPDPGPGWKESGSGMEKTRIRDKHPGSATLFLSVVKRKMFAVSLPDLLGFFKTSWIASKHEMHKICNGLVLQDRTVPKGAQ